MLGFRYAYPAEEQTAGNNLGTRSRAGKERGWCFQVKGLCLRYGIKLHRSVWDHQHVKKMTPGATLAEERDLFDHPALESPVIVKWFTRSECAWENFWLSLFDGGDSFSGLIASLYTDTNIYTRTERCLNKSLAHPSELRVFLEG